MIFRHPPSVRFQILDDQVPIPGSRLSLPSWVFPAGADLQPRKQRRGRKKMGGSRIMGYPIMMYIYIINSHVVFEEVHPPFPGFPGIRADTTWSGFRPCARTAAFSHATRRTWQQGLHSHVRSTPLMVASWPWKTMVFITFQP